MSTPFTLQGTLAYPADLGGANETHSFSLAGSFEHKAEFELKLTGSGTKAVDFGSLAADGAKVLYLKVDPAASGDTAAPVNLRINGSSDDVEVAQGGFLCLGSPSPASGILSLSIVYTQNAFVRIVVLG